MVSTEIISSSPLFFYHVFVLSCFFNYLHSVFNGYLLVFRHYFLYTGHLIQFMCFALRSEPYSNDNSSALFKVPSNSKYFHQPHISASHFRALWCWFINLRALSITNIQPEIVFCNRFSNHQSNVGEFIS